MGCILSKPEEQESNPFMFRVFNVDDHGQEHSPGKLEVADHELILHQIGKEPIRWPLKSLRRYGFDAELFSFESGRRCVTGPGIYAFKCQRAEALFSLVQEFIIRLGQEEMRPHIDLELIRNNQIQLSNLPSAGGLQSGPNSFFPANSNHVDSDRIISRNYVNALEEQHNYENQTVAPQQNRTNGATGGRDTFVLYAELDLPAVAEANDDVDVEMDDEEPDVFLPENLDSKNREGGITYINMPISNPKRATLPMFRPISNNSRDVTATASLNSKTLDHSYANVVHQRRTRDKLLNGNSVHSVTAKNGDQNQKVTYIQLDLDASGENVAEGGPGRGSITSFSSDSNRVRHEENYALIDFQRTKAISCKAIADHVDEGSRKTRHNSNIEMISLGSTSNL